MRRAFTFASLLAVTACSNAEGGGSTGGAGGGGGAGTTASTSSVTSGATSSASVTGSGGSAASLSPEAFCQGYADWYCGMAPSCGCGDNPGWPGSMASCVTTVRRDCLTEVASTAEAQGTFLPDRAAACLATLTAAGDADCIAGALLRYPSAFIACPRARAYAPETLGAPCNIGGPCAGGAGYCAGGTCKPYAAIGALCVFDNCVDGAACTSSSTCVALGDEGAGCEQAFQCKPGLTCSWKNVCAAPKGPGAACTDADVCGVGLHCSNGVCAPSPATCASTSECGNQGVMTCSHPISGICQPPLPDGASCSPAGPRCASGICHADFFTSPKCVPMPGLGDPCPDLVCAPGLGCDLAGAHTCEPPAGLDDPCNYGPEEVQCGPGLACSGPIDLTTPVAVRCLALPGQACQSDGDCPAGERCAGAGVCSAPSSLGEACSHFVPCPTGLTCSGGLCRAVGALGDTCPDDFTDCGPGLACVTGPHQGHGTCQAPPSIGDACDIDQRCGAGLRCAFSTFTSGVCAPSICLGAN